MEKRRSWLGWVPVVLALVLVGTTAVAQGGFGLIHSFTGATNDGASPEGTPLLIGSNLYGVTFNGGSSSLGTIYQVSTNGSGFSLLFSFLGGANGANPFCSLVNTGAAFYGMTFNGGVNDGGVVFKFDTNSVPTYSVLHTFLGGNNDGLFPFGSLTLAGSTLFGMTANGGTNNDGVVFKVTTNGTSFSVLHSFASGINDGSFPNEGVIVQGSILFGTAFNGGSNNVGIVFSLDTAGSSNVFKILHHFSGGTNDGANPTGPLASDGSNLYGLTTAGGTVNSGVVFKVSTTGTGYTILHHFGSITNDASFTEFGPVVVTNSLIYGAAESGGVSNRGALFLLGTDGTGYSILHDFTTNQNDGAFPVFGPVFGGSLLYGTTVDGGSSNLGTVYGAPITPNITTNTNVTVTCMCTNVPANASMGVTIGNVTAGQAYGYSASGCVGVNADGFFGNPDGVKFFPNCSTFYSVADAALAGDICPASGFIRFSLVGKVGGTCIQLGRSGAFVAPSSGPLTLYVNDDNFSDNSGSFNVCVTPTTQMCVTVDSTNPSGVTIGNVVAGQAYVFTASGCVQRSVESNFADPDGNQYSTTCSTATFITNAIAPAGYTCPGLSRFALVGKINGGSCFQLGRSGSFVATDSGPLVLYFNDDNYGDNTGFYSACITPVSLTQVSAITVDANLNILVTVPTVPCMQYQLQFSDEMVPTNWINIAGAIQQGTGGPIQFVQPIGPTCPLFGPCVKPVSGLVSWWPGDRNTQDLAGGNTGILSNGATFASGEVCQAFSFTNAHAGVVVSNMPNLQLQDFSIETWFRRHSTTQLSNDACPNGALFSYGSLGYGFLIELDSTGQHRLALTRVDDTNVSAGPDIVDTLWHHGAVTKSGTTVIFYFDGTAYPTNYNVTSFLFTTAPAIGVVSDSSRSGLNVCGFNGDIDEVAVYNRALSASEIQAIFNASSFGKCKTPGPHRFYRVDEIP